MLLKCLPGGINAFFTKYGRQWLFRGDGPVYECKRGKPNDLIRMSGHLVEIQS